MSELTCLSPVMRSSFCGSIPSILGQYLPHPPFARGRRRKNDESTRVGDETAAIPPPGRDGRPAAMPRCPSPAQRLACTIARMPARTAAGRLDHASTTAARAGSAAAVVVAVVVTSEKMLPSSGETAPDSGLQIRHRRFDSDRSLFLFRPSDSPRTAGVVRDWGYEVRQPAIGARARMGAPVHRGRIAAKCRGPQRRQGGGRASGRSFSKLRAERFFDDRLGRQSARTYPVPARR